MERRRRRGIIALRLPLVLTPLRPFHTPARPVHGPQVRQRREPPGLDRPQDQHQDPDEILRADGPLPMRPVTDVIVGRSMVRHTQQSDQMAPAFDGVRKAEGGEGATGEIAWVPFGVGRSADGLHRRTGAPVAVCGSCDARDGERIRSRELSRTGLARVCGDLRLSGGWVGRRRRAVRPGVEWLAAGPRRG